MSRVKLIELVQTFLTEYPGDACIAITQDGDGSIYYWHKAPVFNDNSDTWVGRNNTTSTSLCVIKYFPSDNNGDAIEFDTCIDYDTAIITRDMFDEAKARPKGDLREWRDRIIEIRELQDSLKSEMHELVKNIELEGFKVIIDSLPRR
jgi:hypothetical protein